jgi:hypothetical protein
MKIGETKSVYLLDGNQRDQHGDRSDGDREVPNKSLLEINKMNTRSQKEKIQNIHAINIYTIKQKEKKRCKVSTSSSTQARPTHHPPHHHP